MVAGDGVRWNDPLPGWDGDCLALEFKDQVLSGVSVAAVREITSISGVEIGINVSNDRLQRAIGEVEKTIESLVLNILNRSRRHA